MPADPLYLPRRARVGVLALILFDKSLPFPTSRAFGQIAYTYGIVMHIEKSVLVDDERVALNSLIELLRSEDFVTSGASTFEEAKRALKIPLEN